MNGPFKPVSVIVPTFREAGNLPELVKRLDAVRVQHELVLELVICDDDSQDGTEEFVAGCGRDWVRLIVRRDERGLSSAVLAGIAAARHELLVVMDADLSHPPERIPDLLAELERGADMVIGSRYVPGASTEESWGAMRWLNSQVATLLARPFTRVRDPMSGFFALRRSTVARASDLNPIGYKIGLELIVKGRCQDVREVPIHFSDRLIGDSKLSLKERLLYLQHISRLVLYVLRNRGKRLGP